MPVSVNVADAMRKITVTVKVSRVFRFRLWLGLQMVAFGFRLTGMHVVVNKEAE